VGVAAGTLWPHRPTVTLTPAWLAVRPLVFLHSVTRLLTVTTNPVSSLPLYHHYSHFCECAVANGYLYVHPFICHARDPCPNGSTYWNAFCTIRQSDVICTLSQWQLRVLYSFHMYTVHISLQSTLQTSLLTLHWYHYRYVLTVQCRVEGPGAKSGGYRNSFGHRAAKCPLCSTHMLWQIISKIIIIMLMNMFQWSQCPCGSHELSAL